LFPFENSWRVILDSFTDDDLTGYIHEIERAPNGVAGGRIGGLLVAPAKRFQGVERGGFGGAQEIDLDDALDIVIILLRQARHEERLYCARICWLTSGETFSGQRIRCPERKSQDPNPKSQGNLER